MMNDREFEQAKIDHYAADMDVKVCHGQGAVPTNDPLFVAIHGKCECGTSMAIVLADLESCLKLTKDVVEAAVEVYGEDSVNQMTEDAGR